MQRPENTNETPLHLHTVETMEALLTELAPALKVSRTDDTVSARLEGFETYIHAKAEAGYEQGKVWEFTLKAPSEWGENDPDEVVQQFCVTRTEQVRQVVDLLASKAWETYTEQGIRTCGRSG